MKNYILSRIMMAFAVIVLSALPALAQITVTGTVTDKAGEPLIGASVLVVGTQNGSATDIDGNFTLKNVAEGAIIRASYVTYKEQEQKATSKMHFVLEENSELLDEVVIVGYGSMKRAISPVPLLLSRQTIFLRPVALRLVRCSGDVPLV